MQFLLAVVRPHDDLDQAARRYIEYSVRRSAELWHPELHADIHVEGLEHLLAARDEGAGVVLNFMHLGPFKAVFGVLAGLGVTCDTVAHSNHFADTPAPTFAATRRLLEVGSRVHDVAIGFAGIVDLLRAGRVVALATDMPGSTPVTFVGRKVLGSSGAARVACVTGSPVVAMTFHPGTGRPVARLHPPLQPAAFPSPERLLDELVRIQEPAVLAWPEAVERPRARWTPLEPAEA